MEMPNIDANSNVNIDIPSVNIQNNVDSMMPNIPEMDMNQNIPNIDVEKANKPEETTQTFTNPFAINNENLQNNLNGQINNQINNMASYPNIPQEPIADVSQLNSASIDQNINDNQAIVDNAPTVNPMVSPIMDMPNNNQISNTQDLNAIAEEPVINQNNIESMNEPQMAPMNTNYENVSEAKPAKKFPLSLRETILVTIALIGIVIVIIMYWQ